MFNFIISYVGGKMMFLWVVRVKMLFNIGLMSVYLTIKLYNYRLIVVFRVQFL
jgi:hypothetical protein